MIIDEPGIDHSRRPGTDPEVRVQRPPATRGKPATGIVAQEGGGRGYPRDTLPSQRPNLPDEEVGDLRRIADVDYTVPIEVGGKIF